MQYIIYIYIFFIKGDFSSVANAPQNILDLPEL